MPEVTQAELAATVRGLEVEIELSRSAIGNERALTEAKVESFEKLLEIRIAALESKMDLIASQTSNVKVTIIATCISTGIASVLAIVLGVGSINGALVANMLTSFESGKNFDASVNQAVSRALQTQQPKESNSGKSTPGAPLQGLSPGGSTPGGVLESIPSSPVNSGEKLEMSGSAIGYPNGVGMPGPAASGVTSRGSSKSATPNALRSANGPAGKAGQK